MKDARLIVVLAGIGLGIAAGLTLPLHADPLPAKEQAAEASGPPLEKMIAELKTIAELVKQLDDPKFETRQRAAEQLIRMGKTAAEPLKRVLAAKQNLETATRLSNILAAIRRQDKVAVFAKTAEIRAKLAKPIDLEQGITPNTPLNDALEFLSGQYGLTFIVDNSAFAAIGVQKPEETAVMLPKMAGVSLGSVLRMLVGQVKGDQYVGTFLIRDGHVAVTTTYHSSLEKLLLSDAAPRVHTEFDGASLEEALHSLADSTGVSVVLDKRIGRKAQEEVSATFNEVPIDTAVRLLADMVGLKVIVMDNVLYVTSKDNALELEAEHEKRKQQRPKVENGAGPPQAAPMG
jgi:hypothetical protein